MTFSGCKCYQLTAIYLKRTLTQSIFFNYIGLKKKKSTKYENTIEKACSSLIVFQDRSMRKYTESSLMEWIKTCYSITKLSIER